MRSANPRTQQHLCSLPTIRAHILLLAGLFLFLVVGNSVSAVAEDLPPSNDPAVLAKQSELELARLEAEIATQRSLKAQAEKAQLDASLPAHTSQPLEGNVEADEKSGYLADLLAVQSLQDNAVSIARDIAGELKNPPDRKIYLVKQADYLNGAVQLTEVESCLDFFTGVLDRLAKLVNIPDAGVKSFPLPPLTAAAPAALGALADVAAMFRVDRSIKGRPTSLKDDALAVAVAGALISQNATSRIIQPQYQLDPELPVNQKLAKARTSMAVAVDKLAQLRQHLAVIGAEIKSTQGGLTSAATGPTVQPESRDELQRLKDLYDKVPPSKQRVERPRLKTLIDAEAARLAAAAQRRADHPDEPNAIFELSDRLAALEQEKAAGEALVDQFESVLKSVAAFNAQLVTVPPDGSSSPLESLAETALLQQMAPGDLILTVGVVSQGGEMELRKSLWTGGSVYHRAGSACQYILRNKSGQIIRSGLLVANRQAKEGKVSGQR